MKIYDAGSFRDPSAKIFYYKDRIFREVFSNGQTKYDFLRKNNLIKELIEKKFLVDTKEINSEEILKLKSTDNSLVIGSPGKVIREVTEEEKKSENENTKRDQDTWKKYSKSIF